MSLVLPIRNEAPYIEACLRGLQAQGYPADRLEMLVIDGGSVDATADLVRGFAASDPRIRLLSNPDRVMSKGLNIGIGAARGEFVGAVSGHSVLPSDYVQRCVAGICESGAWAIGGRIVRKGSNPTQRAIAIATSSRLGVGNSAHNYSTKPGWVEAVFPGFWRRDLFGRIGVFDARMVVNEDNELSYRIRKAGGRIWYDPSILVEYVPRATWGGLFTQYRRYALGKVRVLRKHRGGLGWRHFVPAAWIAYFVLGVVTSALVPALFLPWLAGVAAYGAVVIGASLVLGARDASRWRIAAAVVTLHVAYGLGTWQGLATWWAD